MGRMCPRTMFSASPTEQDNLMVKKKKRRRSLVSTIPKFPTTRGKTKRYTRAKALTLVYECYAKKIKADVKEDRATVSGVCKRRAQPRGAV